MADTKSLIEQIKASQEGAKGLLRKRYWEIEAQLQPKRDAVLALQASRDANIDNLTPAQDRALIAQIKAAREDVDGELEAERKEILRALRDDDGKVRLGSA